MKKISFSLCIMLAIAFASCNQKPAAPKEDAPKMEDRNMDQKVVKIKVNQLASATDYNCGMTLTDDGIADTATYEGKLYGFCSAECKSEFLKDPKAHLPK